MKAPHSMRDVYWWPQICPPACGTPHRGGMIERRFAELTGLARTDGVHSGPRPVRQQICPPRPSLALKAVPVGDAAREHGSRKVRWICDGARAPDAERQPEREIREGKAKAVCAACPVRAECLTYAVSRPEKYGTWGGLNEEERASERRRRMRRANAA